MSKDSITLELIDTKDGVYFPGQNISGKVTLNLEEPKECLSNSIPKLIDCKAFN